jgi:hypothetical protein
MADKQQKTVPSSLVATQSRQANLDDPNFSEVDVLLFVEHHNAMMKYTRPS